MHQFFLATTLAVTTLAAGGPGSSPATTVIGLRATVQVPLRVHVMTDTERSENQRPQITIRVTRDLNTGVISQAPNAEASDATKVL
ncbi:MAG: hypothetical protein ACJARS_001509 [bacterium]|jgi:hypothetical protein